MRVALFEPWPRVCGVTAWAFNLVHGFRANGHHADVVSFTPSGKRRATRGKTGGVRLTWQWNPEEPDVVARWSEAGDVLAGYDLIVLNEPKNGPIDRLAVKRPDDDPRGTERPLYVHALNDAKVPWVTAIHDARSYDEKRAPFLRETLKAKAFTGVLIECRPGAYASAEYAIGGLVRKLVSWPWLPYRQRGPRPDQPRLRLATMGTRVTNHKGFTALVDVAHELPTTWAVELFGAESGGTGPCHTFRIYETLARHHGYVGQRLGNGTVMDDIGNMASVQSPYRWHLAKDGHRIQYTGPYVDVMEPWSRAAIAVHLSTDQIVTTPEYATLESMDAGCLPLLPGYYTRDVGAVEYHAATLREYRLGTRLPAAGPVQWLDPPAAREELVAMLLGAVDQVESGQHDPERNRSILDRWHDPCHLARAIEEAV